MGLKRSCMGRLRKSRTVQYITPSHAHAYLLSFSFRVFQRTPSFIEYNDKYKHE